MRNNELKIVKMASRSIIHSPLLDVITENRFWEKHGLHVDLAYMPKTEEAENAILEGTVDVVVGCHNSAYILKATRGANTVYIAEAVNSTSHVMVTRPGINSLKDLKGKRIAEVKPSAHPEIQLRIYFEKEGIDIERDKITLVYLGGDTDPRRKVRMVLEKEADAAMVWPPFDLRAKRAGLNVIPIPKRPMIRGVTFFTSSAFVKKNEDIVMSLLKALVLGIHFFKTKKEETKNILAKKAAKIMELDDAEGLEYLYNYYESDLSRKPYPTPLAIQNGFEVAMKDHPELEGLNPLSLWDIHYLRELDETGFIDNLYK